MRGWETAVEGLKGRTVVASNRNAVDLLNGYPADPLAFLNDAFRTAFYTSPVRSLFYDSDYVIRGINDAFLAHEGFDRAEVLGRTMASVFGEALFEYRKPALEAALAGERQCFVEWGMRRSTRDLLIRLTLEPIRSEDGLICGILLLMEDTTTLYELETRVSMHEEVVRQSSEAMAVVSTDFRILMSNRANAETWGLTAQEIIGRHVRDVIGEENFRNRAEPNLSRVFAGERVEYDFRLEAEDGSVAFYELTCVPFRGEDGVITGAAITRRDVTKAALMREELERRARQDTLTGLANRYALEEELQARIAKCARTGCETDACLSAFMLVDLDGFKVVNDLAGHSAGDALLKQVAGLLRSMSSGAHIARLGGDEFAIVLSGAAARAGELLADRIIATLETTGFDWEGARYAIRASIGLAYLDKDVFETAMPTVYDVINWADRACRLAKEKGGSRISVYHPGDTEIQARFEEVGNLRIVQDALANGRFELYAMPIAAIDGVSGSYHEVLLRVIGPDGRAFPPGAFIAAAERHQMMTRVDRWVVRHVLERMAEADDRVFLTVNLSGQSVGDSEFRDFLLAELDRHPTLHGRLAFEITETSAVRSMETAQDLIAALKSRDCGIILDDFGSGLSSFGYLRHFDVDMLKIDGNIIGDVANDPVQQTIVAGIVAVAAAMQVRVVAEFVEDARTLETLQDLGVSLVQGYHVGKPAPWDMVIGPRA